MSLATPELWVMNAREAERFWKVSWACLDLEVGCCGREGPHTTARPQQAWLPHLSGCIRPPKPCFPFPPSPGQRGATHLERTMLIVTGGSSCPRRGE